jgi:hypothetical protein
VNDLGAALLMRGVMVVAVVAVIARYAARQHRPEDLPLSMRVGAHWDSKPAPAVTRAATGQLPARASCSRVT